MDCYGCYNYTYNVMIHCYVSQRLWLVQLLMSYTVTAGIYLLYMSTEGQIVRNIRACGTVSANDILNIIGALQFNENFKLYPSKHHLAG